MIPEQPRGYSIRLTPQADRILVVEPVSQFAYTLSSAPRSIVRAAAPPGAWGLLSRVVMVVMTTQPSLGLLGALGQRLWHGLITAPVHAEKAILAKNAKE